MRGEVFLGAKGEKELYGSWSFARDLGRWRRPILGRGARRINSHPSGERIVFKVRDEPRDGGCPVCCGEGQGAVT